VSAQETSGTAAAVPAKSIPEDVLRAQKNFWGQTDTHGLRSIQVKFLGFKDDGVSEKCGLDRERIKSMVQRTVADAGFALSSPFLRTEATLEVLAATSTQDGDECLFAFDLVLTTATSAPLLYNPAPASVSVLLGLCSGSYAGPADGFAAVAEKQVNSVAQNMMEGLSGRNLENP